MTFEERLDNYVKESLANHRPRDYRSSKIIHDSLWGTSRYYPHELVIIDSPIFQRLRRIAQTGLASVAYPSLNHSRFEHSLGVATVVKRFVRKLQERLGPKTSNEFFGPQDISTTLAELRLAALLHDIGHGLFSHLSEEFLHASDEFRVIRQRAHFDSAKPSEILAHLILKTESFSRFFEDHVTSLEPSLNLGTIADLIIGKSKPPYRYCAQIINGSIDADKIDYISRDTFYSGINTTIDVDRLFNDLSLELIDGDSVLVITSTTPLERLLFSKVLLYSSIYHHQKVKAADCMVAGIVEYLTENSVHLCGLDVSDPINFLRITDEAFLAAANFSTEDPFVRTRIRALLYRDLPHRCLVLSRATVNNYEGTVYGLNRIAQFSSEMRALRQAIVETMPADQRCSVHDVWVSLPPQPSLREASQTLVATSGSELISLDHLFPLDGWLGAFSDNKWRGYVFGPYHLRDAVSKAARSVLKDKLGIELNAKALTYAHLVDPGDNEVLWSTNSLTSS